jgi:hypothetical protein
MTVPDAIRSVQQIGSIRAQNGKLQLRFPKSERQWLESSIDVLRREKAEALAILEGEEGHARADSTDSKGVPWADWKAATLNRIFQEQGVTGEPSGTHGGNRPVRLAESGRHGLITRVRPSVPTSTVKLVFRAGVRSFQSLLAQHLCFALLAIGIENVKSCFILPVLHVVANNEAAPVMAI